MGGSTSDHFGLPLEIGPAALVELTGAVGAARGPVEYGGSDDQAEELAAALTLELADQDEKRERLRHALEGWRRGYERERGYRLQREQELEIERAARELAERIAERRLREINRLENEVTALRKRVSELETRRVEYSRSDADAGWY